MKLFAKITLALAALCLVALFDAAITSPSTPAQAHRQRIFSGPVQCTDYWKLQALRSANQALNPDLNVQSSRALEEVYRDVDIAGDLVKRVLAACED